MSLWTWVESSQRYRLTAEGAEVTGQRPGTFVGQARMIQYRERWIEAQKPAVNNLASQLANGNITLPQWEIQMRNEVRTNIINQYMLGHGGRNSMTQADWGRVGNLVRDQYGYLHRFAGQIADGTITSENAIAARSRMYVEASGQAFERGRVLGQGMPDLPQYPGDGATVCLSNCKCYWNIVDRADQWECTWTLTPAENCEDCLALADRYAPLIIRKENAATRSILMEQLDGISKH